MSEEGEGQQHLCECFIDNNGEKLNVLWMGPPDQLIPWPEIKVLMQVHGEQSVYDIKPVALGPCGTPNREKERLVLKYGREVVEEIYAGKSFFFERFMPGWPIDPTKKKGKSVNARGNKVFQHRPEAEDIV